MSSAARVRTTRPPKGAAGIRLPTWRTVRGRTTCSSPKPSISSRDWVRRIRTIAATQPASSRRSRPRRRNNAPLLGDPSMMEVRLFPHSTRPGVGLKPREDSARPLLPQHSRHCPVLEAASGLGLLVYPPLEENEAFEAEFQGDGRYLFTFYMGSRGAQWHPIFRITLSLPLGAIGKIKEDVEFMVPDAPISADAARTMARSFIVP